MCKSVPPHLTFSPTTPPLCILQGPSNWLCCARPLVFYSCNLFVRIAGSIRTGVVFFTRRRPIRFRRQAFLEHCLFFLLFFPCSKETDLCAVIESSRAPLMRAATGFLIGNARSVEGRRRQTSKQGQLNELHRRKIFLFSSFFLPGADLLWELRM